MTNMNVGHQFNNNISKVKRKSFYKQNMHYSARNLWLKMMQHQSSNSSEMFKRKLIDIEDDNCLLCNETEDAKHLLISCNHKLDIGTHLSKKIRTSNNCTSTTNLSIIYVFKFEAIPYL